MVKFTIMTMTIEIAPEIENILQTEAKRKGLSPKEFVQIVLKEKLITDKKENRVSSEILRELLAEGMISKIPAGISAAEDAFEPIKIEGKPLSETILEDRN